MVHLLTLPSRHAGEAGILKDAPVKKLHDVKGRADDRDILAEAVCLWDRDVRRLQRMDDAVLSLDLVGGLGKQLPRRLLAQDKSRAIGCRQLVCRVGLAKAELFVAALVALGRRDRAAGGYLFHIHGRPDCRYISLNVSFQRWNVNRLAYGARHGEMEIFGVAQVLARCCEAHPG